MYSVFMNCNKPIQCTKLKIDPPNDVVGATSARPHRGISNENLGRISQFAVGNEENGVLTLTIERETDETPVNTTAQLDPLDGYRLSDCSHSAVKISSASLKFLEVENSQTLSVLDLGHVPGGLWLSIQNCPSLETIVLSTDGIGGSVHIDFGNSLGSLSISGAISDFDCCWVDGTAVIPPRNRNKPLQNLQVSTPDQWGGGAEAAILVGNETTDAPRKLVLADELSPLEIIVQKSCVQEIEYGSIGASVHICLVDLPNLESVVNPHHTASMRISRCRVLKIINGSGNSMVLSSVGKPGNDLQVKGVWESAVLRGSQIHTFDAMLVEGLSILDCPKLPTGDNIHRLSAEGTSLVVDEFIHKALSGDASSRDLILRWCSLVKNSKGALEALGALRQLSVSDPDPATLWQERCALQRRTAGKPNTTYDGVKASHAGESWDWNFPRDLAFRGWSADLSLWLRCKDTSPLSGVLTLDVGGKLWSPVHMATLLHGIEQSWRSGIDQSVLINPLVTLFRGRGFATAQKKKAKRSAFVVSPDSVPSDDQDFLAKSIQVMVTLREHPNIQDLVSEFIQWTIRNLLGKAGINLIGSLSILGNREARNTLLGLSNSERLSEANRLLVQTLVMTPTRSDVLSFKPEISTLLEGDMRYAS